MIMSCKVTSEGQGGGEREREGGDLVLNLIVEVEKVESGEEKKFCCATRFRTCER